MSCAISQESGHIKAAHTNNVNIFIIGRKSEPPVRSIKKGRFRLKTGLLKNWHQLVQNTPFRHSQDQLLFVSLYRHVQGLISSGRITCLAVIMLRPGKARMRVCNILHKNRQPVHDEPYTTSLRKGECQSFCCLFIGY